MEISAGDHESEQLLTTSKKRQWNLRTYHWIIICIIGMIVSVLVSNMDRIVSSLQNNDDEGNEYDESYDIIIVGGGPSGLLNANLLKDAYPNKNILVIEQLNRVGGRQFSSKITSQINNDTIIFDHCAFRTNPTNYTMKLMQYLDICHELYPYSTTFIVNSSNTLFEIRNHKIFEKDINISYWSDTFNLNSNDIDLLHQFGYEFGAVDDAIFSTVFQTVMNENNATNPPQTDEEWTLFRNNWTYRGITLDKWEYGAIAETLHQFSSEFVSMGRFYHFFEKCQAGFGLYFLSTSMLPGPGSNSSNYYMLKSGYNIISTSLYGKFLENGGNIKLNNKVIGINKHNKNKYIVKTINNDKFECEHIILSIPVDGIKHLLPNIDSLKNNDKLLNILNLMNGGGGHPAMKMILIYNTSTFKRNELNILNKITYSTSKSLLIDDLYFTLNGSLCYLMMYGVQSDIVNFWWNLQQTTQNDLYQINDNIFIDNINETIIASKEVINQITIKLNTFFNVYNITMPPPMAGFASFWGKDINYGAAISEPEPGLNADSAFKDSLKPDKHENIYISVSDFSFNQNVVEGGIWSAVQNVMLNFDIQNDPLSQFQGCL